MVLAGAKAFLNRGMTGKSMAGLEGEARERAAMEQAAKNKEACETGKIRIIGTKAEKTSGAINTEAMRLARLAVKAAMKKKGIKVSYVEASEITKAAKALVATDPSYLTTAKANVEEATSKGDAIAEAIASIPISASKKAKAEKEAAARKADKPLSAAKAGKPAKHKPAVHANA